MSQVKTIYILRHGKASPGDATMEDHERPLLPPGEQAAQLIGNYMKWKDFYPDHILCSTATRTRQTLEFLVASLLPLPPGEGRGEGPSRSIASSPLTLPSPGGRGFHIEHTKKLYLATAGDIFHLLQKLPAEAESVLVVGHNPGLHQFCLKIIDSGDEKKMDDLTMKFPTCALAVVNAPIADWKNLSPHSGTLKDFVMPKSL